MILRRRFDVRFHLLAIAFVVFDVELLFLYPWAIALHPPQANVAEVVHRAVCNGKRRTDAFDRSACQSGEPLGVRRRNPLHRPARLGVCV